MPTLDDDITLSGLLGRARLSAPWRTYVVYASRTWDIGSIAERAHALSGRPWPPRHPSE